MTEINLSSESIEIIINSLRHSKADLKKQIDKLEIINPTNENIKRKISICREQLKDCEYVLKIFEEI